MVDIPKTAQGEAKLADSTDISHDMGGITYPNLHRRIDSDDTPKEPGEVDPDQYKITVSAVNSYRTTIHTTHKEDATDSEIP